MDSYICAIDVGTTGVKAGIVDSEGHVRAEAYAEYGVDYRPPYIAEQDPDTLWRAHCSVLKRIISEGIASRIQAVCMTNQRVTFVPVDRDFQPLIPYIVWSDRRGEEQCDYIRKRIGAKEYYRKTGLLLDPTPAVSKILWLKQNKPDVIRKAIRLWQIPSLHLYRMGVKDPPLDPSNAAWFGLLDIHTLQWNDGLIRELGIRREILPEVAPSGTIVGKISREAAEQTGLKEGTPITLGGGDQQVGSIGCGVIEPGIVSISMGTASGIMAFSDGPVLDESMAYYCQPHAIPDSWEMEMFTITSGAALRWFRDQISFPEKQEAEKKHVDPYELICERAAGVPPGSDGLIFVPTMSGTFNEPYARGLWLGLSLSHGRDAMARSILEGVVYELKTILTSFEKGGLKLKEVRVTGGGAKSPLWSQIQADIYGVPVVKPVVTDAPLLGCLFIAGMGIGMFSSLKDFAHRIVRIKSSYMPDPAVRNRYEDYFHLYQLVSGLLIREGIHRHLHQCDDGTRGIEL